MIITYQDAVEIIMLFVMTIVLVYLIFNIVLDKYDWWGSLVCMRLKFWTIKLNAGVIKMQVR